jgi:hypothetical protein
MIIDRSKYIRPVLASLSVCFFIFCSYNKNLDAQDTAPYLRNPNYKIQIDMYDLFKNQQADVVMLGNSLTYNTNWNEILNRKNIANRGIVSDITAGYLHRLGYVYKLKPKLCFIGSGVNDIYENFPVEQIFENYICIIDSIKSHNIIPVIQSTLYVSPKWHDAAEKYKEIEKLNELLSGYASKNSIEYLNINSLVQVMDFYGMD